MSPALIWLRVSHGPSHGRGGKWVGDKEAVAVHMMTTLGHGAATKQNTVLVLFGSRRGSFRVWSTYWQKESESLGKMAFLVFGLLLALLLLLSRGQVIPDSHWTLLSRGEAVPETRYSHCAGSFGVWHFECVGVNYRSSCGGVQAWTAEL